MSTDAPTSPMIDASTQAFTAMHSTTPSLRGSLRFRSRWTEGVSRSSVQRTASHEGLREASLLLPLTAAAASAAAVLLIGIRTTASSSSSGVTFCTERGVHTPSRSSAR